MLAQTLEIVGRCARIAWWDGSAVGLSLNGFIGLIGVAESDLPHEGGERRS